MPKKKQSAKRPVAIPAKPGQKDLAQPEGIFTRRRIATGIAALLAMQLLYTVIFGRNGVLSYAEKRHQSVVLAEQINRLQQENIELQDKTTRLEKDPNAIEHQAREQLHYTRPGEVIYTLPNKPQSTPAKK